MKKLLVLAVAVLLSTTASAENPYLKPNESWISISGTVQNVTADRFTLDYGKGLITVEMDDGDRDGDAYKLISGDKVTVSGMIDADLFERKTIEASSVYVEKLGTTFYASALDEEDIYSAIPAPAVAVSETIVRGTVSDVDDEEFTLSTGNRELTVEVDAMAYNPLDDIGFQKVRKGDKVSVSGRMDYDFLAGRELVADSVVTLKKAEMKKQS